MLFEINLVIEEKSNLLTSPAYRQAGFSKGRNNTPLWQRGARGDFVIHVNSILRYLILKRIRG